MVILDLLSSTIVHNCLAPVTRLSSTLYSSIGRLNGGWVQDRVTDVAVSDENVIFIGLLKSDRTLVSY